MKVVLEIESPGLSLYPFDLNLVYDDSSWSCLPGYFQDSKGNFDFSSRRGVLDLWDEQADSFVARLDFFRRYSDLHLGLMGYGSATGGLFGATGITWTVKAGVPTTIRHVFGELRRKIIVEEDERKTRRKRGW